VVHYRQQLGSAIEGTHLGELSGIPATGKRVKFSAMSVSRLTEGKQVEHWVVNDRLARHFSAKEG